MVGWTQGFWDFIRAHENDPDPGAMLAQDFDESKHTRDERGRFADRGNARPKSKLRSALLFGKVTSSLERLWDYRYEGAMANYLGKWMDQLRWQRLPPFQKLAAMLINRGRGYKNLSYLLLKARRMAVTNTEYVAFQKIRKAA